MQCSVLMIDYFSKNIRECSNWDLVFTSLGKYFFYNKQTEERCWIPPESVLNALKDQSENQLNFLFDPFHIEEDEEDEDDNDNLCDNKFDEGITSNTKDSTNSDLKDSAVNHTVSEEVENAFKVYLLKNSVDPFAPWPKILSIHSQSSQFQAISSDKRKQELFTSVCPILIEMRREESKKKLSDAKTWWTEVMNENLKDKIGWFQVLKKVQRNPKFALLNEKDCEKEYKAGLAKK